MEYVKIINDTIFSFGELSGDCWCNRFIISQPWVFTRFELDIRLSIIVKAIYQKKFGVRFKKFCHTLQI